MSERKFSYRFTSHEYQANATCLFLKASFHFLLAADLMSATLFWRGGNWKECNYEVTQVKQVTLPKQKRNHYLFHFSIALTFETEAQTNEKIKKKNNSVIILKEKLFELHESLKIRFHKIEGKANREGWNRRGEGKK